MRRFFLESATGDRYDLNGSRGVFATDPTGLGFTAGTGYANLRNGFYSETRLDNVPQATVGLTLNFVRPGQYAKYRELFDWLLRAASPLLLLYDVGDGNLYRRQVRLEYVNKTEIALNGLLVCALSLKALSPWYLATDTVLRLRGSVGASLRYTYRYTQDLRYGTDSRAAASANVTGAGHIPASFLVRAPGPLEYPVLSLRGISSGKIYGRCSVGGTVEQGSTLILSTRYRDSYCAVEDETGQVQDILNSVDLTDDPFFHAPVSEDSVLELNADGEVDGATAEINYYYWSV